MSPSNEDRIRSRYVHEILEAYRQAPETGPVSERDRRDARALYRRGVPVSWTLAALHLVILRRAVRPRHRPKLEPIRSLRYILPALDELERSIDQLDSIEYLDFLEERYRRYRLDTWPPRPSAS